MRLVLTILLMVCSTSSGSSDDSGLSLTSSPEEVAAILSLLFVVALELSRNGFLLELGLENGFDLPMVLYLVPAVKGLALIKSWIFCSTRSSRVVPDPGWLDFWSLESKNGLVLDANGFVVEDWPKSLRTLVAASEVLLELELLAMAMSSLNMVSRSRPWPLIPDEKWVTETGILCSLLLSFSTMGL